MGRVYKPLAELERLSAIFKFIYGPVEPPITFEEVEEAIRSSRPPYDPDDPVERELTAMMARMMRKVNGEAD